MKKTLLSIIAITAVASASTSSELALLKKQIALLQKKIEKLEKAQKAHKKSTKHTRIVSTKPKSGIEVDAKAVKLKFSGTHYIGLTKDTKKGTTKFETRRNYLQVKAYFTDNPKNYMRVTLDTHQDKTGDWKVRLKYAYLYLDNVLPYTGVEIGQAHRPWIDYEEHNGWLYRSISKTLVETDNGAHFINSADLGINFKTKTDYFSSEIGVFNGEGYHGLIKNNTNPSFEWRATAHLLGTGKKHPSKHLRYANVSFFGQYSKNHKESGTDFAWYGIHAVYNQPEFLIAAQYVVANKGTAKQKGKGWSVNGEYRFLDNYALLARYDNFKLDSGTKRERVIGGLAYDYSKNVKFIANYIQEKINSKTTSKKAMLTAEVNW